MAGFDNISVILIKISVSYKSPIFSIQFVAAGCVHTFPRGPDDALVPRRPVGDKAHTGCLAAPPAVLSLLLVLVSR